MAAKNEHTLHVFDTANGRRLWNFTAGGRIDSPPTIYNGLIAAEKKLYVSTLDGRLECYRPSE